MSILIDTDPGIDDILALMLACQANLNIKAISVVAGNSILKNTYNNTRYLTKLLYKPYPVIPGEGKPLKKKLVTAVVHGKLGLGDITPENVYKGKNETRRIKQIIEKDSKLKIIALGPLTNIAKILKQKPLIANRISEIVIMGGAINEPGNQTNKAEFNFYVDPEAVQIVLKSPIKKILIPLDICNKVILPRFYFDQISNRKIKPIINKIINPYVDSNIKEGYEGAPMYDPLAVYYLINKKAYKIKKTNITIELDGSNRGKIKETLKGNQVFFAYDINKNKFKEDFLKFINKQ